MIELVKRLNQFIQEVFSELGLLRLLLEVVVFLVDLKLTEQLLTGCVSVHDGHIQIQQNDIVEVLLCVCLFKLLNCLVSIACFINLEHDWQLTNAA